MVDAAQLRLLQRLLAVVVLISVVHYGDNYWNWADYPQPDSGPAPSQAVVGISWFVYAALAAAGYLLFTRGRVRAAAVCLALYSTSGLIGVGHFTVEGAFDMPLWRQAHIVADIAGGIAILAFCLWVVRRSPRPA